MGDLSASDALAALKAALDRGDALAPADLKLLASLTTAADAATDLPDELVVPLRKAVMDGGPSGVEVRELELREPTAAEMLAWDKLEGREAEIVAVSTVAGVNRKVIEQIGARDLLTASRYIGRFLA